MSEDTGESQSMDDVYANDDAVWDRETAPQSPYTTRQVAIGFVVLVLGALVAFALPLALA